jgi:hypothetical protein
MTHGRESNPDIDFADPAESMPGEIPAVAAVERRDRNSFGERAMEQMRRMASETNASLGKKMLDTRGRIKMSMFGDTVGEEKGVVRTQ